MSVEGRVVVVTGGARGLGRGIAHAFVRAGARVVIADCDAAAGAAAAEAMASDGLPTAFERLDVRDPAASRALVERVVRAHGSVDVWVNAARVAAPGPAQTVPPCRWEEALSVNLSGAFFCCQAAGQQMLTHGRGVIINVSTVLSYTPIEGEAVTAIADAGLVALTQALGVEWARSGVRVVGVAVGAVMDVLEARAGGETAREAQIRRTPMRRLGTSDEVADAILYLADDDAAYVVAETLRVDGGWVAYQLF